MNLTAENVEKVFRECFSSKSEENIVKCDVVAHSFSFYKDKLQENKQNIIDMLSYLPKEFMQNTGGGYSFLMACNDKDGKQWTGLHLTMEKLFALGTGIERVKCLLPRELWQMMPGGMPYFMVLEESEEKREDEEIDKQ